MRTAKLALTTFMVLGLVAIFQLVAFQHVEPLTVVANDILVATAAWWLFAILVLAPSKHRRMR